MNWTTRGFTWLLVAVNTLMGLTITFSPVPAAAFQSSADRCLSADEAMLLDRVNTFRALNSLSPLTASPTLTVAARHQSESMATHNYFPDDYSVRFEGPDASETITWQENIANAGYPDNTHTIRAAIIGAGTGSIATIYSTLTELPAYRQILSDPRLHAIGIGFGSSPESDEGSYWTLTFGSLVDGAFKICEGVRRQIPIVEGGRTDNSTSSFAVYDGDLTTSWMTDTKSPPSNAFVWIDLGSAQEIGSIEWLFSEGGAADSFTIDVSLDRETWAQVTRKSNSGVNEWRSVTWSGSAQYVRFFFANPNLDATVGYLAEVRVFH